MGNTLGNPENPSEQIAPSQSSVILPNKTPLTENMGALLQDNQSQSLIDPSSRLINAKKSQATIEIAKNLSVELQVMLDVAMDAADIIKYYHDKEIEEIPKGGGDFKTKADDKSQELIIDRLQNRFLNCKIIAEEDSSKDLELAADGLTFVVDPLDGTAGFKMRRGDNVSTLIACYKEGKPFCSVVVNAITGDIYIGEFPSEQNADSNNEYTGKCYLNGKHLDLENDGRPLDENVVLMNDYQGSPYHNEFFERLYKKLGYQAENKPGSKAKSREIGPASSLFSLAVCDPSGTVVATIHNGGGVNITTGEKAPRKQDFWDTAAPLMLAKLAGAVIVDENFEEVDITKPHDGILFILSNQQVCDDFRKIVDETKLEIKTEEVEKQITSIIVSGYNSEETRDATENKIKKVLDKYENEFTYKFDENGKIKIIHTPKKTDSVVS